MLTVGLARSPCSVPRSCGLALEWTTGPWGTSDTGEDCSQRIVEEVGGEGTKEGRASQALKGGVGNASQKLGGLYYRADPAGTTGDPSPGEGAGCLPSLRVQRLIGTPTAGLEEGGGV